VVLVSANETTLRLEMVLGLYTQPDAVVLRSHDESGQIVVDPKKSLVDVKGTGFHPKLFWNELSNHLTVF